MFNHSRARTSSCGAAAVRGASCKNLGGGFARSPLFETGNSWEIIEAQRLHIGNWGHADRPIHRSFDKGRDHRPAGRGSPLCPALAAEDSYVVAQGAFEKLPPSIAPTPYSPDMPQQAPQPRHDFGQTRPPPAPSSSPSSPSDASWGAIAFTADGSYSSTWKMNSQPEAEAKVLRECAKFGRGGCEVVTFSGQECVALSTFIGNYRRRRWNCPLPRVAPPIRTRKTLRCIAAIPTSEHKAIASPAPRLAPTGARSFDRYVTNFTALRRLPIQPCVDGAATGIDRNGKRRHNRRNQGGQNDQGLKGNCRRNPRL